MKKGHRNLDPAQRAEQEVRRLLIHAGERLSPASHRRVLELGPLAISALINVVRDEGLVAESSPGEGWAPIHAARLLGELRATEAIEPLIEVLARGDVETIIHSTAIYALAKMGEAAVEPVLQAYARLSDTDALSALLEVMGKLGVKDERIFQLLTEHLGDDEVMLTAMRLANYGDPRALPLLLDAFDRYELVDSPDNPLSNQPLIELRAAVQALGGTLSPEQEAKYARAMEAHDRWREMLNAFLELRRDERTRPDDHRRAARPGRNEACWCGSGKKYKKCHLATDEGQNRASSDLDHTPDWPEL